jgi:MoxR-like ATPase
LLPRHDKPERFLAQRFGARSAASDHNRFMADRHPKALRQGRPEQGVTPMRKFVLAAVAAAILAPVLAPAMANAQPVNTPAVAAARHDVRQDRAEVRHDRRALEVARARGNERAAHIARHELRHDKRDLRHDRRELHHKIRHAYRHHHYR